MLRIIWIDQERLLLTQNQGLFWFFEFLFHFTTIWCTSQSQQNIQSKFLMFNIIVILALENVYNTVLVYLVLVKWNARLVWTLFTGANSWRQWHAQVTGASKLYKCGVNVVYWILLILVAAILFRRCVWQTSGCGRRRRHSDVTCWMSERHVGDHVPGDDGDHVHCYHVSCHVPVYAWKARERIPWKGETQCQTRQYMLNWERFNALMFPNKIMRY